MACGACGRVDGPQPLTRVTFPDGTTVDYVSRQQAVRAAFRAGGGELSTVQANPRTEGN